MTEKPAAPMRLRADAPRVTRLSRKMLAGVGAVALLGIGGALIYALQTNDTGPGGGELYSTENRPTADGLAELPRDYTGPVLGPALPGDLGRPILDAQNRGQPVVPPTITTPTVDPEEQRRLAEEEAARLSNVFFQVGPRTGTGAGPALAGLGGLDLGGVAGPQDGSTGFLNGPVDRQTVSPDRVAPPASPYILQAGAVIPAALITGLRSDLPGQISAQVTSNVYDSPSGRFLLIPQGARLLGEYDSRIASGQSRLLLVWTRLILPDGRSIVLERAPGTDGTGASGLQDRVNYHWGRVFLAAGLATILNLGLESGAETEDDVARAIREAAQDTIGRTGDEIVRQQLAVPPTLTIRPGFPVRVMVTRDLILEPLGEVR